ncbi:MAG: biotin-dependent carboxyltransferase family protein [Candidatus Pelagadaptatus aseana]|uniref:5-oxoprolinase subunit C family protein n=1 Tax=Candidatus Pelagadaptatus aseana TaxID=3120508 RepID=UPI0039B23092
MSHFEVINPGILSLLQDAGRLGKHQIGLTTGGPLDPEAFYWANQLCGNDTNTTTIEITVGGLQLEAQGDTTIAVTGANMALTINGEARQHWRSWPVQSGDRIALGFASEGCRAYLAVAGGFQIEPMFDSTATVVREGIGGLSGGGLQSGDKLPCTPTDMAQHWQLPEQHIPHYSKQVTLRVIPGYQEHTFSRQQQRLFFHNTYTISDRADRMGIRLEGPKLKSSIEGILSEGICLGAIQVPADGQPIILMNDRQTIGGYPKIGSVLSLDLARLAQLMPGDKVNFAAITIDCAHNALHLAQSRLNSITKEPVCD